VKKSRVQNRSISLEENLLEHALERCNRLGLKFSHYIAHLVEADIRKGGDFIIFENPPDYPATKKALSKAG
jgi:hypothetical protein